MNSSLVSVIVPANEENFTYGRSGYTLRKITIHHMAGIMSAEECGRLWQNPNRQTSSNYGIGVNGEIGQYVDETNTSWCDSNWESNCTSITIENSNDQTGGEWHISDATLDSLIKLCADISIRNNLGYLVPGQNLTWHSMYAATTCPGDYLRSKMEYIASEANKIISGGKHIIAEDGLWGRDTTTKAQEVFGTIVDGTVSNQLIWWKDENPGLLDSTFEWQDFMGDASMLIARIQELVGAPVDGWIGRDTITKMQKYFNTPVDGCVSNPSTLVKAFQHWLNEQ